MAIVKAACLLFLLGSAYAKDPLYTPCKVSDKNCVKEAGRLFYENNAAGLPEYGLKPTDPLHIDIIRAEGLNGVKLQFKNITVTGLKHLKLDDFVLDTKTKSLVVKTTANLNIESVLAIEYTEASKTSRASGKYTAKANTIHQINHKYDVITDDKGVQYLSFHDEEVDCENASDPDVKLGDDLEHHLNTDPVVLKMDAEYQLHKAELAKQNVCIIVKESLKTHIDNIRSYYNLVPLVNIFTDFPTQ